jgi:hypothetical protein
MILFLSTAHDTNKFPPTLTRADKTVRVYILSPLSFLFLFFLVPFLHFFSLFRYTPAHVYKAATTTFNVLLPLAECKLSDYQLSQRSATEARSCVLNLLRCVQTTSKFTKYITERYYPSSIDLRTTITTLWYCCMSLHTGILQSV